MGSSLIEQLQTEALERSVPITDLVRKAKIAAVKLGLTDFAAWVELETSGYYAGQDVPRYRLLHAELKFLNPVRGWCPIIGGDHERTCRQSVAEITSMVEGSENSSFMIAVPRDMVERYSRQLGFQADVKSFVQRAALAQIIEAVRDTLLDWALKLEQAGVHGTGLAFSKAESEKAQRVTINIGSIGNAVGLGAFGDNAAITATQELNANELAVGVRDLVEQLDRQLPSSGLPQAIRDEASSALAELREASAAAKPDVGRLRRGLQSLQHIMEDAAGHLIATGALALIAKLLTGS